MLAAVNVGSIVFACALSVASVACTNNPSIDGTKVPPLGASATCTDVCNRIVSLCGFAPLGVAGCSTADASGYCDTQFTSDQLTCIGQATSCQTVWDQGDGGCAYVPPAQDAGADDSATDATDDSSDAASE